MADFLLTAPDGTQYRVSAPDEKQAYAAFQKMLGGMAAPEKPERGIVGNIGAWVAGSDRDPTIGGPMEMKANTPEQARQLTALLMTTKDPDRLRLGIQNIEPDAQFQKDQFGNDVVLWPRKDQNGRVTGYMRAYPDPAGLDVGDVARGAGVVAAATGIGKGLQLLGLPASGLLGGAAVGGGEAALSEYASAKAAGDRFDPTTVPYGVAGGVLGELGGRAVASLIGMARKLGPSAVVDASGRLLPRYAELVQKAGLDPDQVSAAVAAEIANMTRSGVEPSTAAVTAMSRGLPEPVPMTKGQLTGSKGQQLMEDVAASGGYGNIAEALMAAQRQRQQGALQGNLNAMLERLNLGAAPIQRGVGGAAAQAELVGQRTAAKEKAGEMFRVAREGNAVIDPAAAADIADGMRATFREGFNPRTAPTAAGMLDDFDNVAATGDIKSMMAWRSQMTGLGKGAPTVDGAAARQVLEVFDTRIKDAVDQALLAGDANAATNWANAISNYAEFSNMWRSKGGILNLLTEETTRDGARVLRVAPEQAADAIFTATASGLANKTGLARDLVTLQRQLPPDQWNQLRQEAFLRLMDTSKGAMRGGETQVSGVNFKKALDTLRERNAGVMNALFTKEERDLFAQFANVAARATGGAVNASNSANAAAGIIQRLAGSLGRTGLMQFLLRVPIARGFQEAYGTAVTSGAIRNTVPATRATIPQVAAGAGGIAGSTTAGQEEMNNRIRSLLGQPR